MKVHMRTHRVPGWEKHAPRDVWEVACNRAWAERSTADRDAVNCAACRRAMDAHAPETAKVLTATEVAALADGHVKADVTCDACRTYPVDFDEGGRCNRCGAVKDGGQ